MTDPISRQAALDTLAENKELINAALDSLTLDYNTRRNLEQRRGQVNEDIEAIKELPPAEPKHGKWIHESIRSGNSLTGYFLLPTCSCSECNCCVSSDSPYCPNCGAKMEC